MKNLLTIHENGLHLSVSLDEKNRPKLTHFSCRPQAGVETAPLDPYQLVQVQGEQPSARYHPAMGSRQNLSLPGLDLSYLRHTDTENRFGRKIEIHLAHDGLDVVVHWQFHRGIPVLRSWLELRQTGPDAQGHTQGLEMVASFFCHRIDHGGARPWTETGRIHYCVNSWCSEMRWRTLTPPQAGLTSPRENSSNRFQLSNTGSWSTKEHLPLGLYENTETGDFLFWQIESSGSWSWEIGDQDRGLYLYVGGPDDTDHHWFRRLREGETFTSVAAAVGWVNGTFDDAMGALTRYRRVLRRPHWDNEKLPVIFNDYMNCLFADPTTEKELPLIEAAAQCGAEIYVIDAGWYARLGENWWDSVGEWQPSPDRFEGGLTSLLQVIREAGMIPGLWLELEVMGVACPLAHQWPDECFFRRRGKRLVTRGRLQLDYRHPIVRAHADKVVRRLVENYGVGYIKMDYNVDAGTGTEVEADSFGDGLLQHNRAYLDWLRATLDRHPKLIIENCSSGGLRMDYALLTLHSIQSTSDQEDYRLNGAIAAAAASGATPEQQAVWSYPKREGDREETIFNLVNALLNRMHQSGHLADLSPERRDLVREAIAVYKDIRHDIRRGLPIWPTGLPRELRSSFFTAGLTTGKTIYLSAWKVDDADSDFTIPLPRFAGQPGRAQCLFPDNEALCAWQPDRGELTIRMEPHVCARLFRVEFHTE